MTLRHIEDLASTSINYTHLITVLTHKGLHHALTKEPLPKDMNSTILVDTVCYLNPKNERFISYAVSNGEIVLNSKRPVHMHRKHPVRVKACDVLRQYPEVLKYGTLLNPPQKKLLMKGLPV